MIETTLNGQTFDIVAENVQKIKALFPEIVIEDKIDFEKLQAVLGEYIDNDNERYNFTWNGKGKALRLAQTPSTGTLRPCKEESKDWDNTQNLYIEGDNLEVLKLLQKTYHNKIKMIYIDPPYNTGKDFIYPDDYKDNLENYLNLTGQKSADGGRISTNSETSGRYHTNWLNMMYPRLRLARNLLTDDGVVFISIDDNEVDNLKKICNEIFGEENLVGVFSWKNKYGAGAKTKGFIEVHEYILCYSKTEIFDIQAELTKEQIDQYNKKDEKYSVRGGYITQPLMTKSMDDRNNLKYPINYDGDIINPRKQWVWEESRLLNAIKNDEVVFKKKKDGTYSVRAKVYLKDKNGVLRKGKPTSSVPSWLNGPFNQEGTDEVASLLGDDIFDFPKPKKLLKYILSFLINGKDGKNGIYLDFFSGSGTYAHSVLDLNKEDGGNRKFILVQLPEYTFEVINGKMVPKKSSEVAFKEGYKTIADIGKERIRRAGEMIRQSL